MPTQCFGYLKEHLKCPRLILPLYNQCAQGQGAGNHSSEQRVVKRWFLKWGEPQTGDKQSWNLLSSLGDLLFIQLNCKEKLNSSLQRSKLKREGVASLEVCPWE